MMNGRRIAMLVWVAGCDGFLGWLGWKALSPRVDVFSVAIGLFLCCAGVAGTILEILKHRWAAMINVGTLALLTAGMATAIVWLPLVAMHQSGGDAGEAAIGGGALLLFSLVPLFLTIVTGVLYWAVDVESDRAITLRLEQW